MVISNSGPKMVLVEQFEQSWCFLRLSPEERPYLGSTTDGGQLPF